LAYDAEKDQYSVTAYFGEFQNEYRMLIDTMSDWTILDDDDQLRSELKKLKDVEGYPVRT